MPIRKKILVIEDDPEILGALELLLEFNGFEFTGIVSTQDISETLKLHQPDLVLTDYVLPGMNGGMICKAIKTSQITAHIPVILMTAYHKQAIALGNFGYDAYLPKPFDNKVLIGIVQKLLNE
jgi:two-component system phosphate regulon response regulator PhoB